MTMRTSYPVVCECGNVGHIHMSENDQPYSKPWESYKVEGLKVAQTELHVRGFSSWKDVFVVMKPRCAKCNAALETKHLSD